MLPGAEAFSPRRAAAQDAMIQYAGSQRSKEGEALQGLGTATSLLGTLLTTIGVGAPIGIPLTAAGAALTGVGAGAAQGGPQVAQALAQQAGAAGGQDIMGWLAGVLGTGGDGELAKLSAEERRLLEDLK